MSVHSAAAAFVGQDSGAWHEADVAPMLEVIYGYVDGLVGVAVPESIRQFSLLTLPNAVGNTLNPRQVGKMASTTELGCA